MSQLRMIWRPGNGGNTEYTLREGYTVRGMNFDEIEQWNDVSTALTGEPWSRDRFLQEMIFKPPFDLSPAHIYCAYDRDGKMMSTAAACVDAVKHIADLHMVSARPECRGLGLGKAVCAECVKYFEDTGCVEAHLSTDDFRKPAIAIYLKLGYRPWLYEDDMPGRWNVIFGEMGYKTPIPAYTLEKEDTVIDSFLK